MTDFSILGDTGARSAFWFHEGHAATETQAIEPRTRAFVRDAGTRYADLHRTTGLDMLISERFLSVLVDEGASGCRATRVSLTGKKLEAPPPMYLLEVDGRVDRMQDGPTRLEERRFDVPGGKAYWAELGVFVEWNTWSGHDLFVVQGSRHVGVTPPVAEALAAARLSNVKLTPNTDYKFTSHFTNPAESPRSPGL